MLNKLLLFISILILLFFSFNLKNFHIDASSDTLVAQNDKDFEFFNYYNEIFPSRSFLILAIKSKTQIDSNYIKNIQKLKIELNKIDQIENTVSIIDIPILNLNNIKLVDLKNYEIENIQNSKFELSKIIDEFSESYIFKDQFINSKKNLSSIVIYTKASNKLKKFKKENNNLNFQLKRSYIELKKENNQNRNELIKEIRTVLNKSDQKYEYYLGGIDMIADDVISFVKKDIVIFSIVVLIFIILILLFIFRDIKWIVLCLLTSGYSVLSMFGLVSLLSIEVTAISANFASLMFILSISMNIHIINNYKKNYMDSSNYLLITLKRMIWPCVYTVLTTIVAFGSLLISDIKPIIDFGFIMIISLIIILITSFTILPLLINLFPDPKNTKNIKFTILEKIYLISIKHSKIIILLNIGFLIISIYGISKLNVENSFINYFKKNTEIYKGMKIIDNELGGTTPIDIIIKFENESSENAEIILDEDLMVDEDLDVEDLYSDYDSQESDSSWFTSEKIDTVKKIHLYLENKKEVGKVQSIHTLIETANMLNKKPLTIFELSILYNEIPVNYKNQLLDPYMSTENNMMKISARVKDSKKINRNNFIKDVNNYLKNIDSISEFKVNGLLVLYNNMLQSLFSSQIKSLGLVIFLIFLMFIILFKSLKLSILGIIPNIIASSLILGVIGLFRIPLDIMTITIAAITIGIAVDNTIHYLYRYKENYSNLNDISKSIKLTHNNVGYAILTTSLTITLGFSVLILSSFVPTILFGIFTSLAMLIAMIGVLLTLPSLLNKFNR